MLAQAEEARALLAANRQELQSGRVELERQLESARAAETKLQADLDRVRAEGNAVSAIVGKREKRIASLEADLKAARAAAETLSAQAADAKAASAQVAKLQEQVTALGSERDAAKAEAARAGEEKAALEREIAALKDEVGKLQAKLAPEMTGTTPTAP
jgi:structural maintenance of chromosome 2